MVIRYGFNHRLFDIGCGICCYEGRAVINLR